MEKRFVEGGEGERRDRHFVELGIREEDVPARRVVARKVGGVGQWGLQRFGRFFGRCRRFPRAGAFEHFGFCGPVVLATKECIDIAFVGVDIFEVGRVDRRDISGARGDDAGLHHHLDEGACGDATLAGDFKKDFL